MKSARFRFIALGIVMAQFLSLLPVVAFASSDDKMTQHVEAIISDESIITGVDNSTKDIASGPKHELKPVINSEKVVASEKIKLGFDKANVIDYYYISDGVTVKEKSDDSMQFELIAVEEFGYIDVYADYGNGELVKSSVYTYKQDETVYVSDISKDRAWYNCMESKYNAGEITLEEWEDAYSEFSRTMSQDESLSLISDTITNQTNSLSLAATSNDTTVRGRLRWETDTKTKLPLRNTLVELRDKEPVGSRIIASTYTDFDGYFSFEFDNPDAWYDFENGGLDVFIRWYTQGEGVFVAQDLAVTFNYMDSRVVENVQTGSNTGFYYYVPYDDSSAVNKSFYVLQGMILGHNFAKQMGFSSTQTLNVLYPVPPDGAFSYFGRAVIGNEYFDDFDTLVHEYGHFVEQMKGNYSASLLEIIINDPNHYSSTDHFDDKKQKEYAMELTWSEAWATAFSQIAQEYYKNDYIGEDGMADRYDGQHYDTYTYTAQSGEAQEDAVIAFLWDLYDNVLLGSYQNWWNYTTRKGTCTLTDFVNIVETYYPNRRGDVGRIMASHQISPGNLTITNKTHVSDVTAPTLSWRVNGSTKNPNNRFQVVFYDNYGNYIYSSPVITSSQANNSTYTYTVSQSTWNQVIKSYGGTFTINIAVRGYHTKDPISGPYISEYAPITLTVNKSISISVYNRYTENQLKLDRGGYCDYIVTFGTSGYKLIQTFGTKDTVIELYSASGTLLKRNDDGGYGVNSLVSYYCTANTKYQIRVKFWSSYVYGNTKLTIIPAYGALNSDSNNLETYEDIYAITTYTAFTWITYAQKNYTRVITYTPPSRGSYTFTIDSDFDTYIYVIDPRSSELVKVSRNYDDDSGEGMNPLLTTTLEADVPYLVIYSAFDPYSLTSTQSLTVQIRKN